MSAAKFIVSLDWLDLSWIGLGLLLLVCALPALSEVNLISRRFATLLLDFSFKRRIFSIKCDKLFIFLDYSLSVARIRFLFFFPLALIKLSLLGVDLLIKSRVFAVLDAPFQFFKKGANSDGNSGSGHGGSSLSNVERSHVEERSDSELTTATGSAPDSSSGENCYRVEYRKGDGVLVSRAMYGNSEEDVRGAVKKLGHLVSIQVHPVESHHPLAWHQDQLSKSKHTDTQDDQSSGSHSLPSGNTPACDTKISENRGGGS